jgi:membrane-associated phospholipid phosphatase
MNERKNEGEAGFPFLLMGLGIGFAVLFVLLFAEVAEEMLENEVKLFDAVIIQFFQSLESRVLDNIMIAVTELGSVWFLTVLSVITVLILGFKEKDGWGILFFVLGIGGGGLLTSLLKHYYQRGRPSINPEIDAVGYSFPSGHSLGSLIFYGFIAYFLLRSGLKKSIKWLTASICVLLFIVIGVSRIYLGAHFPSDVLAGQLAGAIWLILCILALQWLKWQKNSGVIHLKL